MSSSRSTQAVARVKRAALVLGLLSVGWAVLGFRPDTPAELAARHAESAQAALLPFKQQLMAALQRGLAEGPEAAIEVCRIEAPRIAKSVASEGVRMGRTSHRLRNPANAPKRWMRPILEEMKRAAPGEIPHRVATVEPGRVGYAEPIYVQPPCLTCHGASVSPSIASRIQASYPEDRATGFAVGDFRGLFWVELAVGADGS